MLINYQHRRAQGRPISSAGAECAVDYVTGQRMTRNGHMHWSQGGANALLDVRCAFLNGQDVRNSVRWNPPDRRSSAAMWARPRCAAARSRIWQLPVLLHLICSDGHIDNVLPWSDLHKPKPRPVLDCDPQEMAFLLEPPTSWGARLMMPTQQPRGRSRRSARPPSGPPVRTDP